MSMQDATQTPPRVTITDLASGFTLDVQHNPERLREQVSANYGKLTVPGMSHEVPQFSNTASEAFEFRLEFRATSRLEMQMIQKSRRFLKSLCFPRGNAEDVRGGAPPRVLLVWPGMLSLTCLMESVQMDHVLFNKKMQSRVYSADLKLSEVRDFRISSQEVFGDNQLRYGLDPEDFFTVEPS